MFELGLSVAPPYAPPLRCAAARVATPADVLAACSVRVRTWDAAYTGLLPQGVIDSLDVPSMWASWTAMVVHPPNRSTRLLVVGPPGEVHAHAWTRIDPHDRERGEVGALYSDPTAWGTPAGHVALEAALDVLRAAGHPEAILWMVSGNERAARFYERAGWTLDGGYEVVRTTAGSYEHVRYRRSLP